MTRAQTPKLRVTTKSRKYKKQAAVMERLLNQPSVIAQIEKRLMDGVAAWLLYGCSVGTGRGL